MAAEDDAEATRHSGALLAAHQSGDATALSTLIARHLGPLRGFVRLQVSPFLRERETESDIVQSVCRELLERKTDFVFLGEAAFRSWLYHAVLNKVRDREKYFRADKRGGGARVNPDTDLTGAYKTLCSPSRAAIAAEELRRVEEAFTRMPERYVRVLTLSRLVGMDRQQIADELQATPDAVSQLLRRAVLRLEREMR